jgi:predicted nucleic acid-binding Zn ribbon protein
VDNVLMPPPGQSADVEPAPIDDGADRAPSGGPAAEGDLARSALDGARRMTRPRRRSREAGRRTRRENLAGRNTGGYSAPGPDLGRDPQRLGPLLAGYIDERGWDRPLAEARVFAEWSALVGADVAAHCAPQSLTNGELRIAAESTAWATQLRLLSATLLARLVAELGREVVTKLIITGPVGPSWKHGGWSVRGGRGPRDTYG